LSFLSALPLEEICLPLKSATTGCLPNAEKRMKSAAGTWM